MEKYDQIGVGYNQTRKADHYLLGRMIHFLDTKPGGVYLDIGCGTGNYTIAFSNRGVKLIGIDPSEAMLSIARSRSADVEWKNGKAESIPLADNSVDGILAVLTTHHWTNQNKGYAELGRVLKPGGTIVIFTATPEQMKSYWLSHYFPKMLQDGRKQMLPYETIEENLLTGGFTEVKTEKYFVTNDLQDLFLQCGKYNPAIYLDEQVRRGISSFATAKNAEEVQSGLASLRSDIDSGNIEEVVKQYESEVGDYLFVIAKKS
ncbi:MAG TPA: class I SAM-dependent methyltransferase [Bacteroidia bacterium]|nr:class I SAM-dependent methyltransferase [Bacteroidia bacterium]